MTEIDTLLSLLYRLRADIHHLLSEDRAAIFNVPRALVAEFNMEKTLSKALSSRLVRLRRGDATLGKSETEAIVSNRFSQLPQKSVQVELTAIGGAVWEQTARPRWPYFVDEAEAHVIRGTVWVFLEGRTRAWLDVVNETLSCLGFFPASERHVTLRKGWRPVYWKQFKVGYSLGINTQYRHDSPRGKQFLQGIALADDRLSQCFSTLAAIWDAGWQAKLKRDALAITGPDSHA